MKTHRFGTAVLSLAIGTSIGAQVPAQTPPPGQTGQVTVIRERASVPPPQGSPLPPLSQDAQLLIDRLKQDQSAIVEQLRYLQQTYRDAGRAEDAAAIAAQVRLIVQRPQQPPPVGVTAELVNEGLPLRDQPVFMSAYRAHLGETLSFAIRGRADQSVWGTAVYTDDSGLETAAVHAGLLRAGQAGIVKVRVLPGQDRYDASDQNGVRTAAYLRHAEGSYRFTAVAAETPTRSSSLASLRDLVGQSVVLPAVGTVGGGVWGTDIYTDDSALGAAAVHAGVLRPGEFGFVKVTLLPGQRHYDGSPRGGVTSQSYEDWEGSFRVEFAPQPWVVQLPGGEDASRIVQMQMLRGRTGLSFVVQVVGASAGPVWGSGIYTDDSSIAAAAVHAGVLKPGELGFIRVTIAEGRDSYESAQRNGITSQPYEKWEGSFRLERVK